MPGEGQLSMAIPRPNAEQNAPHDDDRFPKFIPITDGKHIGRILLASHGPSRVSRRAHRRAIHTGSNSLEHEL